MSILLMKDLSLKGRLVLILVVALLAAAVALYSQWEGQQYRAGHRKTNSSPVETAP